MSASNSTKYNTSVTLDRISREVLTQDDLASQIIIRRGKTYHIFNKYILRETGATWEVTGDSLPLPIVFNTAKVALAWCILQKVGHIQMADNMHWLDSRITAKQIDINMLTYALENIDQEANRATLLARLSEDINTRQSYKKQLLKIVQTAKYIKLKGTHNAINRSNKTNGRSRRY